MKGWTKKTAEQEAALLWAQRYNERQKEISKTVLIAVLFLPVCI